MWDADGTEYVDLLAGIAVNCLGHAHPAVLEAVTAQLATLGHVSNLFTTPAQIELAEALGRLTFPEVTNRDDTGVRVFLANSGTEANEAAFKIARRHGGTDRPRVLALEHAFHGRTMGALALTHHAAYREPFEPLPGGVEFVPPGDVDALRHAQNLIIEHSLDRVSADLPWYRTLPEAQRSQIEAVARLGVTMFVDSFEDPTTAVKPSHIFSVAPATLTGSITLGQTLALVRTVVDVVQEEAPDAVPAPDLPRRPPP